MEELKNRELFINAIMNSDLSPEEKKDFSELVARDLEGTGKLLGKRKAMRRRHSPKDMVAFLYLFSQDEFFKWFTHDPEQTPIDYTLNYSKADERLKLEANRLTINTQTFVGIRNFICDTGFSPKDGFGNKIPYSWKDVVDWIGNNPDKNPFRDCILEGKPFKDYVSSFKNAIEFRTDDIDTLFNIRLYKLIEEYCDLSCEITNNISFDGFDDPGSTLRAYIDVRMFFSAIQQIFQWIQDKKAISSVVSLQLESQLDCFVLSVFHKGSVLDIDERKIEGQDGDFKKVRDCLFCVADWAIEADWRYEGNTLPVRIDCLNSGTYEIGGILSPNEVTFLDKEIGGVKHYIKFYKNIGK